MKYLFVALILLSCYGTCLAEIYYVKQTGNDTANDGKSWSAAFFTLQKALEVCQYGDQIWVAKGTYKPTAYPKGATLYTSPFTDRDKSFHIVNGVKIYGGFIGIETSISQRVSGHSSILSGDIGIENNDNDNCYHVVLSIKDDSTTLIDGFTITKGYGGPFITLGPVISVEGELVNGVFGGGMLNIKSFPTLNHVSFTQNYARDGGGMLNTNSSPSLTNVSFLNNRGFWFGGGINNANSSPKLINVTISSNTAQMGGGMLNNGSSPSLVNVTFSNNSGSEGGGMTNRINSSPTLMNVLFSSNIGMMGGGMHNDNSSPQLNNVLFVRNYTTSAGTGGGMHNWFSSAPILKNVIFWENSAYLGAAMSNSDFSSPILTNVTFAENATTGYSLSRTGGVMYNIRGSSAIIRNGILWGNKNVYGGAIKVDEFYMLDSSKVTITYSLMQLPNNDSNYPPASFPAIDFGHNLFAQNPLFVDAASGNLRLQDCSPAINAGDTSGTVTHDLDGKLRPYPYGVAIGDMGAYENQSITGGGPLILNIIEPMTNGTVVKVAGEITATNRIEGARVIYQATKSVTLLPDFLATGNSFTAFIGGCETP